MLQMQLQNQIQKIDVKEDILGISVLYQDYIEAHNNSIKVCEVYPNSPAE